MTAHADRGIPATELQGVKRQAEQADALQRAKRDLRRAYSGAEGRTMYKELYKKTGAVREAYKRKRTNLTGIPETTKQRFEEMSGYSFDDVRIHYSSDKPARLKALAYTRGSQVYIAPGQERCLEHELVHVVQQKEGRVRPTLRIGNIPVNDDAALEREADVRWRSG